MSKGHHYKDTLSKHSKVRRLLWEIICFFLFRPTPRWLFFNTWRVFLLRLFGAKIGKEVTIHPSCRIWAPWNLKIGNYVGLASGVDCYNVSPIDIGDRVTVSQRSYLCTASHDVSKLSIPLIHEPIKIEERAWICAEAFVSPGITVGEGAVVAACAVVVKDVPAWSIVGGNPAKVIKKREIIENE